MSDHSQQPASISPQTPGSPIDVENSIIDNYQIPERISEPTTLAASAKVEPVHGDTLVSTNATPEYGVPERILEPSTVAAVANVEPVRGETLVSTRGVFVEDVDVKMPGALPEDDDRFYESDEEEPHILDAVKSAAHGAQETLGNLLGNASNLISSTVRRASTSRAVAPPDVATAGATTGSVAGTVAGTVHAATDIARAVASNAAHTVVDTVRPYLPSQTAAPATAPVNPLENDTIVTATARTIPGTDDVIAVDAHVVQTPLPPPVTASPPAQPSLVEKAQSAADTARDFASSAYQTVAEKAAVATAVASDLTATATEKASGVAATTSQQGAVIAEKTRETATTAYDSAAYEALNARAAAQVSANQSYEQSAQRTAAALEAAKEKAAVAVNAVEGAIGVAVVKASEVATAVKSTAEAAAHKAADVAHSVAVPVVNTATAAKDTVVGASSSAYQTTSNTAGTARDTVVGASSSAYGTVANTAVAAKDRAVDTTSAAYTSVANTATAAKDTVVGAGSAAYNAAANTAIAAKDAVVGTTASAYQAAANTATAAKDTVVGTTSSAYQSAASSAGGLKDRALGSASEVPVVAEEAKPGVVATAQQKLADTAGAVTNAASNVASTLASAPSTAYNSISNTVSGTTQAVSSTASNVASTLASAPSNAYNYVRGVPATDAVTERSSPVIAATGALAPEYVQGVSDSGPEEEQRYSREEIADAEEAERARRNKPGESAREAFEHARQEAGAFASGLREHLGEAGNIPALSVPRRELIREAEETERLEREDAAQYQRSLAEDQAHAFKEGLKNAAGADHLHSAVDIARTAQIHSAEESEREARIKSLEPAAALAVAAAVREGLTAGDSAAVGVARREVTRDAEEQAREEKINTASGERSIAHNLAAAFEEGVSSADNSAAGVARLERIRNAEEEERADRIQEGWKAEALAHEQARLVATGLESVDLKHVTSAEQAKATREAEEAERERRIKEVTDEGHQAEAAPAVAAALKEGLQQSHATGGVNNPAISIANRELGKDEQEKERQERIDSGDVLRNAGAPTQTAFAVRSGLLHQDNPATAVARKTADSEGVQDALPSVAGRGITPSSTNALPSPTKTAYDVVRSEASQQPSSHNIPITNFGRNSPTKQLLGHESLLAPRPLTPERAESIAATQGSASDDGEAHKEQAPAEAPVAKQDQDVGLKTIRPSPSEVVRESDIVDDLAPTTHKHQNLTAPTESQASVGERSISPESRLSSSSLDSEGNKKPKKLHGLLNKAVGKIEVGFGKVTRNTGLIEKGQELHAAGAAEIAQAREGAAK